MSTQRTEDGSRDAFTIDRAYLREQAQDAMKTFFSPLAGVVAAFRSDPADLRDGVSRHR